MSITTLFDFKFEDGHVLEVRFNGLPSTAPKKYRFQWYMLYKNVRYELAFKGATETTRKFTFDDGTVDLDIGNKRLEITDSTNQPAIYLLD